MGYLYEACDEISDFCHQYLLRKMWLKSSMCTKINKVGKQEVGIWWVQKRFPRYGVPIWSLWPNIRFVSSIVAEKNVTKKFNVYKNQLSQQTGSRNLTGPKTLPTIWHTYMKLVTKYQISAIDSCWEKCGEKYLGRTEGRTEGRKDGQTDRGKTVYPLPLRGAGGIIKSSLKALFVDKKKS